MNLEPALINVAVFWALVAPHEYAHAWVAVKLGDQTPRQEGRLTLAPLAHADLLGTVILPLLTSLGGYGFLGWGRPVRVDPLALRGGPLGLALVSLAGPVANLVLAVMLSFAAGLATHWLPGYRVLASAVALSAYLAFFNLLPIPPLDGSKLLAILRPVGALYEALSRYGILLLVAAIALFDLTRWLSLLSWRTARLLLSLFS